MKDRFVNIGIFTIISFVFFIIGVFVTLDDVSFSPYYEKTKARVVETDRNGFTVGFVLDGQTYVADVRSDKRPRVDKYVTVYYNTQNPNDCAVSQKSFGLFFTGFSGLLLLLGITGIVQDIITLSKRSEVRDTGDYVIGKITGYSRGTVATNGIWDIKLHVEAELYDGSTKTFYTDDLKPTYIQYLNGTMGVYYDVDNPKKYSCDIESILMQE